MGTESGVSSDYHTETRGRALKDDEAVQRELRLLEQEAGRRRGA